MIKNLSDNRISKENKEEFNNRGWTLIDLRLSPEVIKSATLGLKQMKSDAKKLNYGPRRIYFDHLFNLNIAAIELPFNKVICNNNVKNLFREAKIGSLIKSLMNWEDPCCDLSRLFCMNNYKYRGNWHRDYDDEIDNIHLNSTTRKIILAGIYLLPQKGFRLLKKDFDYKGKNSIIKNKSINKAISNFNYPLSPTKDAYYEINGKIGTVLFFDPLLLHQGSNFNSRLDFHMKFYNCKDNDYSSNNFQDFKVINILNQDFDINSNKKNNKIKSDLSKIPFYRRSNLINRFVNSIDYRFCLRRISKLRNLTKSENYSLLEKEGWKIDKFSNSIWQN